MDQIKTIPINKWTKKYYVDPVFSKSRLEAKSIKYLKNQNNLDFKKISQILNNHKSVRERQKNAHQLLSSFDDPYKILLKAIQKIKF